MMMMMMIYTWIAGTSTQKHSVFSAPDAHIHISLSYTCMSIQPAERAVEHLRERESERARDRQVMMVMMVMMMMMVPISEMCIGLCVHHGAADL